MSSFTVFKANSTITMFFVNDKGRKFSAGGS